MVTYFHNVFRGPVEIMLEYTISAYMPATYDDPAEGGEVEIVKAFTDNAANYQITDDECERWQVEIAENHDHSDDDFDDRI